jgi:peptidylprolyl isomerase
LARPGTGEADPRLFPNSFQISGFRFPLSAGYSNAMNKMHFVLLTIAGIIAASMSPSRAAGDASGTVSFSAAMVSGATNMLRKPEVTSESTLPAGKLKTKDLVVGKGEAAAPTSTVTVQYVGVRYADGKQFDSSWDRGGPTTFPLKKVVRGFAQGIGGNDEIPPMKIGGRRLIIVPAELGYGENGTPNGSIPPYASIVFVVDLIAVK